MFSNWAPSPAVKFEISVTWLAPTVPYVTTPVLLIVASPLTATAVATLLSFPTNILPLVKTVNANQLGTPIVVIESTHIDTFSLSIDIKDFFTSQGFVGVLSNKKNTYRDNFDLKIMISKNRSLTLYDSKNKKIASFKSFSDLQKEDF